MAGSVATIAIAAIAVNVLRRDHGSSGQINRPADGQTVARSFEVSGALSQVPRGHHVWIASRIDGLLYPMEPEIPAHDGRFAQEVADTAGVLEGAFSLALVLVSAKGQREIDYWLLVGALGDGFPGLDGVPGSKELDAVRDLSFAPG